MKEMQLFLFGPPRLIQDDQEIVINRRKMHALLAYLLVTRQPHSRESLAALLWPEFESSSALANLRRDLSRLKEGLGNHFLQIERDKVQINLSVEVWVDVSQFEARVKQAQEHGHFYPGGIAAVYCEKCMATLQEAELLYTDDFLAGFNLPDSPEFDEWQFFHTERLRGLMGGVLNQITNWHAIKEDYKAAIESARRWLLLDPLNEPAHQLIMKAYAWSGQLPAALRQYKSLVDLLQKELGIQPEAETTALYEAIRSRKIAPPEDIAGASQKPLPTPVRQVLPSDRYQSLMLVSTGGFGEIYHGRDQLTGKEVAIKRLLPNLIDSQPEVVKRFIREGDMLGKLSHPNIVPMLDFYESNGQYHLVMEYMPGGTLRGLLEKEARIPVEQSLNIAIELADALGRAHHLQILHRDLKPENILLDADGHPRLIDFGLALLEAQKHRITQTGMLMGSPAYMSPEALHGQDVDARSDIWSFGVVLFEMLTGRLPFEGQQFHTLVNQIVNHPAPSLRELCSEVPESLEQLVLQMLEKDLSRRLSSMRMIAAQLEMIRNKKDLAFGLKPASDIAIRESSAHFAVTRLLEIPNQSTPLIGREKELTGLMQLFNNSNCRFITLVGPGGIGKTRLAVEVAREMGKTLPNGAVFVPLAPVNDVDLIFPAIANCIHVRNSPGVDLKSHLFRRLYDQNLLLVLDNFEHLIEGSEQVIELLTAAPNLRLLITSRERLNLMEEWVYEVSGLPYPSLEEPIPGGAESWLKNFSAVQLFVERARRADPGIELNSETLADIIRICQLVEGMPLALELSAPWVRAITCKEIVHELEQGLDLLTTSMRNLPDRHRNIRVIFDQSWHSLTQPEQTVLARLSVLRSGCTREAAEQFAEARPAILMTLVDKALLRHRSNRYEMHELIRQYASERLSELPNQKEATYDQHKKYYLDLVAQVAPWLRGGRQLEASNKITTDIDNIRAAWHRAIETKDWDLLSKAAIPYWLYSEFRGTLALGEATFRAAAETIPDTSEYQASKGFFLAAQGSLIGRQWQLEKGKALMEQGINMLRQASPLDAEKTAFALAWFAFLNLLRGQFRDAARAAQESLNFFPQTQDLWTRAGALRLLGAAQLHQGMLQNAHEFLNQCVDVCKSIGELRIRTYALTNLGVVQYWYGNFDQANQYFEESLRVSKSCNDRLSRADALCEYGKFLITIGDYERAIDTAETCTKIYKDMGRQNAILATIVLGDALRLKKSDQAEEVLNKGLYAAQLANHRPDIAYALEGLGVLALDQQKYNQAGQYLSDAIEIWKNIGNEPEIGMLLCYKAFGQIAAGPSNLAAIKEMLHQALRLSQKHASKIVTITAMVGLEVLRFLEEKDRYSVSMLLYTRNQPSTPYDTRQWIDYFVRQFDIKPSRAGETKAINWQTLVERWAV